MINEKTTMLEAEVFILRHLVSGYVTMPPEEYFRAVAVWHAEFRQRHDDYTGDASNGAELLQELPETKEFYKRIGVK